MGDNGAGGGLDVLLVEDDPAVAKMYRIKLDAAGHRVRIAEDGRTGLREALERPPQALLLDVRLPGLDGLELLARLREDARGVRLPVIMLSNYGEPEVLERSAELGALMYLIKARTSPAALVDTLCGLLSGRPAGLTGT